MGSHKGLIFQPSNELIVDFLKNKRLDPHFSDPHIKDIGHICSVEPWDLATESKTESEDQVPYFFYEPHHPYRGSDRAHRRTEAGHWKITRKDCKIEANGLTGTIKTLTFYRHGLPPKEGITDWVMHEYHVKDDPSYQKEFVLCRIQRKRNKKRKRGISTTDKGKSSEQLVSPPQPSPTPSDLSISNGNQSEENTHTIPHQQLQNHKLISCVGNHNEETTLTYPQQLPNHNRISYTGNIPINQEPQPNYNLISHFVNQSEENSPTNPLLPPNSNLESQLPLHHPLVTHKIAENNSKEECLPIGEFKSYDSYNRLNDASVSAVQSSISQEQELRYSNSSFDNCDLSDSEIYSDEQVNNLINSLRDILDEISREETGKTLNPDFNPSKSDGEALAYAEHCSDTNTVENNAWVKELLDNYERLLNGEFKSYSDYNRLNDASFPAVQTPISQEQELKYSKRSFDNCDSSDRQVSSDVQVNSPINSPRAFQDENSCEETGKTLTPDFNLSKSDGEDSAYAEYSSNTNTAYNDAWMKKQLENFA